MSDKGHTGPNRRELLKGVTGAAAGLTVASSGTTASAKNPADQIADEEIINNLLEAAGNPEIHSVHTKESRYRDKNSLLVKEASTTAGKLVYGEFDRSEETKVFNAYFEIQKTSENGKRGRTKGKDIPKEFRRTPGRTKVILTEEDGEVRPRRSVTKKESELLAELTGVEEDQMVASYDIEVGDFFVLSDKGEKFKVELGTGDGKKKNKKKSFVQRPATSVLKSEYATVIEITDANEVSAQHNDDCFDLFGPCPSCVAGGVTCVACAGTCVTGPQCALCMVATCGFAGGACGCCLVCVDNIPDPDTVFCPD